MENMIEKNYSYEKVRAQTSNLILDVFEKLMENVELSDGDVKVDNLYIAQDFVAVIGQSIQAPTLQGLVNRGMLCCEGKLNGKNIYAITSDIYNYYQNTYKPGMEQYKNKLNRASKNCLQLTCRGDGIYQIKGDCAE